MYACKPPPVCPKPWCRSDYFIPHEDGWQCWNCMKIIYQGDPLPLIPNNHPQRVGPYRTAGCRQRALS
ncbi:hypothetical protein ACFLTJ_02295 [Chloroflexota bacterium]